MSSILQLLASSHVKRHLLEINANVAQADYEVQGIFTKIILPLTCLRSAMK
jgi:hypothetical protein